MYLEGKERAKIGKVTVDINGSRYRLRFTYPKGKRHQLKIAQVSDEGWAVTLKAAQLINRDIDLGDFDDTYSRYSPSHAKALELASTQKSKEPNLLEIWERYKELNKARIAKTSQDYLWKDVDRYLDRADSKLLEMGKAQELLSYLLSTYAVSTVATMFRSALNPAVNAAVNARLIKENPFSKLKIPKPQKKAPEIFTSTPNNSF